MRLHDRHVGLAVLVQLLLADVDSTQSVEVGDHVFDGAPAVALVRRQIVRKSCNAHPASLLNLLQERWFLPVNASALF